MQNALGASENGAKLNFILAPAHKVVSRIFNARASLLRNDKRDKKSKKKKLKKNPATSVQSFKAGRREEK